MSVEPGACPESPDDLRNGERVAFVRFYELYRLSVYNLVLRLARSPEDAVAMTRETFVKAYRQLLLREGDVDVRPLVYRAAVDSCVEHGRGASGSRQLQDAEDGRVPEAGGWEDAPLARRFEQTLQTLEDRQRAALLLNDVLELPPVEIAAVLGLPIEATEALLFRASERFRRAFVELPAGRTEATCRLAETAAASAVGRHRLPAEEARKLREHATYCRQCRTTTETWDWRAIGLGLFVKDAPLPPSLRTVPIFGTVSPLLPLTATEGEARPAQSGVFAAAVGALTVAGRALTSKAAAYAVAAVCSAAFLGLAVYVSQHEWQVERRPVLSRPTVTATGRTVGRAPMARTTGNTVASRTSGHENEPASETSTLVASAFVQVAETRDVGTPALALLSSGSTREAVLRPAPSGRAAPRSSTAGSTDVRSHRGAKKHGHARAGGARASEHGGPGSDRLGGGRRGHWRANEASRETRHRPHPSRGETRHKRDA